jgi:hypothetical protein
MLNSRSPSSGPLLGSCDHWHSGASIRYSLMTFQQFAVGDCEAAHGSHDSMEEDVDEQVE